MDSQLQNEVEQLAKLKKNPINPTNYMQLVYLSELAKTSGLEFEVVTETQTRVKFKPKKEEVLITESPNNEHFIHMLFEDSKKFSHKISNDFDIKSTDNINIDSFLKDFHDKDENSLDLIKKVRVSDWA